MFEGKDLTKLKTDKDWEGIRGAKISTIFQDPMTSAEPDPHDRLADHRGH